MNNIDAFIKTLTETYGYAPELKVVFISPEDGWCASIEMANGAGIDAFGENVSDAIKELDELCAENPDLDDEPGMP